MSLRQPRVTRLLFLFAIVPFLMLTTGQPVKAEKVSTEEWNISADKVLRYEDPNSIVAQGNVILEKKEKLPPKPPKKETQLTAWSELLEEEPEEPEIVAEDVEKESVPKYQTTVTIEADWMVYDVELESIKAKGNLHIITDEDELFAKEGTLNLENETGTFGDATILREDKSLHLEGKTIEKTGFDTYQIIDGWVITCKLEDDKTPPWSFASTKVDVRQGGYAILKNARFNIKNVPVFYSPYLIVPVKNTRQTGFLFPEFSSSTNNGFGFNLPFFLNISDSADATFFPEYLHKRGFMPGAEFRYMAGSTDKGTFTASHLDDKLSDPSETEYYSDTGYLHDNSDRYWLRGKADHNFGDWQSRLDIDIVSDQDYLKEFDTGYTGFDQSHDRYLDVYGRGFQNQTNSNRQNTFKILRSWDGMSLQANLLGINEAFTEASSPPEVVVLEPTEDGTEPVVVVVDPITPTPLWKLPSIDFTGAVPIGETSFSFDWNADYVNYWREEGVGGHRVDLRPSISAPIPLSQYLETTAEVAVHDTFYIVETYGDAEWENDDTQNRLIPEFDSEIATTLIRDFYTGNTEARSFDHTLRPYVQYGYIPDIDQDEIPRYDDVDFVAEKNAITYGIDNFFNAFRLAKEDKEKSREYGFFKIFQSYDLRDDASDEPLSDIDTRIGWNPLKNATLSYKTLYDVYDSGFNSHTFESAYINSRGDYITLDYSFKEAEDIEQINGTVLAHIFDKWSIGGEVEHSISQEETVKANASLTYQALCWSVKFETRYTPEDTTYLLLFNLANIGVPLGVNF